jgi:hypothetical protein
MGVAKGLKFFVDGVDIAPTMTGWDFDGTAERLDATSIATTNAFRSYERGFREITVVIRTLFEAGTHGILSTAWTEGDTHDLLWTLPAEGNDPVRTLMLEGVAVEYRVPVEVGGLIFGGATFKSQSDIAFGTMAVSTQLNAGTTNGATLDNGAATTNGATLSVHLTNDDSTDADFKLQHSTNGTVWVDVTDAVVNNLTTANPSGSVTVSGTINRYTRVVSVITGGDTFAVNAGIARG